MVIMELLKLMKERYSCRSFADDQISDDQLNTILEAGRISPSAINRQPWRFLVIQSGEGLAKVDACSRCRYGAPTAILVCFDNDVSAKNPVVVPDYGWVDCGIAIGQMALAAEAAGVQSCIVGAYDPQIAREKFALPENLVPFQFLMLGYAAQGKSGAEPSPRHEERLSLAELVTREAF